MEQVSVETILCLPHNQYRFKYKINDGSFHFIDKNSSFKFFSQYLLDNIPNQKLLTELLHSFLPFIIIPNSEQIFELKKDRSTKEEIESSLKNMTEMEMSRAKQTNDSKENSERLANDDLLNRIENQILKLNSKN